MYIVVEFVESQKQHQPALRQALLLFARSVMDRKLGCLMFDVGQDEVDRGSFLIYQVYTSKASYTAHIEMPEFADHRALCDPWTSTRRHLTYELISGSGVA